MGNVLFAYRKVVINGGYGSFGLSPEGERLYYELAGQPFINTIDRSDANLVKVVESLGHLANGPTANLHILDLPASTTYEIGFNDGLECVYTDGGSYQIRRKID